MNSDLKKVADSWSKDEVHKMGQDVRTLSLSLPTSVASTFCVDYHRVQIQNEIEQCNKEIDEMYKAKEEDIMGG